MQPADYEPPFFRCCSEEEAHNQWMKNPLKMEVGHVNSKHLILALKVRDQDCQNLNARDFSHCLFDEQSGNYDVSGKECA